MRFLLTYARRERAQETYSQMCRVSETQFKILAQPPQRARQDERAARVKPTGKEEYRNNCRSRVWRAKKAAAACSLPARHNPASSLSIIKTGLHRIIRASGWRAVRAAPRAPPRVSTRRKAAAKKAAPRESAARAITICAITGAITDGDYDAHKAE